MALGAQAAIDNAGQPVGLPGDLLKASAYLCAQPRSGQRCCGGLAYANDWSGQVMAYLVKLLLLVRLVDIDEQSLPPPSGRPSLDLRDPTRATPAMMTLG